MLEQRRKREPRYSSGSASKSKCMIASLFSCQHRSFHQNRGQDTPSSSAAGARAGRNARTSFLDIGQRLEADKLALLPWEVPVCMADGDEIFPIRPLPLHDVTLPFVQEYGAGKMPLQVVVPPLALRDFELREEAHSLFFSFFFGNNVKPVGQGRPACKS